MVKGNGTAINDDEILSDVEIVYALAKTISTYGKRRLYI